MDPINTYIENREYVKHLRSLCNFLRNVKNMDFMPEAARKVEVFVSKKSMHGTINIWPFNVIQYLDEKDKNYTWTIMDMYNSIVDNRDVHEFLTHFDLLVRASIELNNAEIESAKLNLKILESKSWWEESSTLGLDDYAHHLVRNNLLVEQYRDTVGCQRLECSRILMRVLINETRHTLVDRDGDHVIPENISIQNIIKRVPK